MLLVWAVVLLFVILGIAWGAWLVTKGSPRSRRSGVALLVVSGLVPLSCCVGPSLVIRLAYGNYPLGSYPNNSIKEGMTAEQVVAVLGTPHERYQQGDAERWYYWIDSFGINWFGVEFGADGRVVHTHGN